MLGVVGLMSVPGTGDVQGDVTDIISLRTCRADGDVQGDVIPYTVTATLVWGHFCFDRLERRMCSLTTECVLLLQNVFSYYRMFYMACLF